MTIVIIVLSSFYEINRFLTFLDVKKFIIRVDANRFKQNEIEVTVVTQLIVIYVDVEILIKNIVILTRYIAQIQLLKRILITQLQVQNVEAWTID